MFHFISESLYGGMGMLVRVYELKSKVELKQKYFCEIIYKQGCKHSFSSKSIQKTSAMASSKSPLHP